MAEVIANWLDEGDQAGAFYAILAASQANNSEDVPDRQLADLLAPALYPARFGDDQLATVCTAGYEATLSKQETNLLNGVRNFYDQVLQLADSHELEVLNWPWEDQEEDSVRYRPRAAAPTPPSAGSGGWGAGLFSCFCCASGKSQKKKKRLAERQKNLDEILRNAQSRLARDREDALADMRRRIALRREQLLDAVLFEREAAAAASSSKAPLLGSSAAAGGGSAAAASDLVGSAAGACASRKWVLARSGKPLHGSSSISFRGQPLS